MVAMLTRSQWNTEAQKEAAKIYGRKHAGRITALQYAREIAAVVLLAVGGFGAWWVWEHARDLMSGATFESPGDTVPTWVWVAMGVLAVVTFVAFRPGRIDTFGVLVVKVLTIAGLWLWLIGMAVGFAV